MNLLNSISRYFGLSEEPQSRPGPLDDFWYQTEILGATGVSALQSTAVYSCVRVIAETLASLPCKVYERVGDGKRVAREHPLYSVLHDQANGFQTANEFIETKATHVLCGGNGYSEVLTDSRDNVGELVPIEPQYVQVISDRATNRKGYRLSEPGKSTRTLFDGEILHIPGLSYDGRVGYSPISAARRAIEMQMGAEKYADRVFKNSAIPPAYVALTGQPDAGTQEAFSKWWKRQYGGANQGSMGFVYNGEIKTVNVNHRDLQFLELRKFQLEEIARIYRVPLHLIQSLDRSTNNNIEHQSLDFVIHTILPWVVRFEKRLNAILLGPQERKRYYVKFSLDALMRGDSAARAAFYASGIQNGWLEPDEARAKEDLDPVGGAAKRLYIQGATVPLDQAGQAQAAKTAP